MVFSFIQPEIVEGAAKPTEIPVAPKSVEKADATAGEKMAEMLRRRAQEKIAGVQTAQVPTEIPATPKMEIPVVEIPVEVPVQVQRLEKNL